MINEMTNKNLSLLNYSSLWLEAGLLTESTLAKQVEDLKSGDDDNTEHYRYKSFKYFIDRQITIDDSLLKQIIELLKLDLDKSMAGSATLDLLKKKYLTNEQFIRVASFLQTFGDWTTKYIEKEKALRFG